MPQQPLRASTTLRVGPLDAVWKIDSMAEDADLEERFEEVFLAHYGPLVVFFRRRGLDLEISQDLAQDTLLRVFRGLTSFEGRAELRTWVRRIAINVWKNWLRAEHGTEKRRSEERSLEELLDRDGLQVSHDQSLWPRQSGNPERHLVDKQDVEQMDAAILALPFRQKTCVRLWLEGWTYQEIASRETISIQTVRASLSRARNKLTKSRADTRRRSGILPRG